MSNAQNDQGVDLPRGLGQPAIRALLGAGCRRLEDVARLTLTDLKQLHGIGPRAIETLRLALAEKGLSFADQPNQSGG